MLEGRKGTSSGACVLLLAMMTFSSSALAYGQDAATPPQSSDTGAAAATSADPSSIRLTLEGIQHEVGHCYTARIPLITPNERDEGQAGIQLFEDDLELNKPNTHHADIRESGGGGFSQWGETLYFSSSDGTDPMTNGRRYTIVFQRITLTDQLNWAFTRVADIPTDAIQSGTGCEFTYDLPPILAGWSSDLETLNGSRLILLEDGAPLSHPHSRPDLICSKGAGRYVHYGSQVQFSSSDNSNPKTNGRVYTIALAGQMDNRFVDPIAGAPVSLQESLPAPVLEGPSQGSVISDAQPTFRVNDPDPSLLYYWELDVVPTFDSPDLHRQPRACQSRTGGMPLRVLDREPNFAPEFTPPYRLGALAPVAASRGSRSYTRVMTARLGYGLPAGERELKEVYAYVSSQFYSLSESPDIRDVEDTWQLDRGFCVSVNYLASRILADLGYRSRRAQVNVPSDAGPDGDPISSHSSLEVFWNGRWSIFDPWLGFYLDGVSYESLSTLQAPKYLVLKYDPTHGANPDDWRPIYLSDYARGRRYDRFDDWFAGYGSANEERAVFSGETATVPEPDWKSLWSDPQMEVWVRVRSVSVPAQAVLSRMVPRAEALNFHPDQIDVSPWTTVSFTIDLAKAYGFDEPK